MHILHINTEKPWRGGEQQLAYLIDNLAGLGVHSTVACRRGSRLEQYCLDQSISNHPLTYCNLKWISGWQLYRYANHQKFDAIHVHNSNGHTIANFARSYGLDIPLVVSKRTDFPIRRAAKYTSADAILCVSDRISEIVKAHPQIQCPVSTVYSGINPNRFDGPQVDLKTEYQQTGKIAIGNCSAISEQKDYTTFLKTAAYLLENTDTPIHFFVIGTGPQLDEMKELSRELGISQDVTFTGFLDDLDQKLKSLDLFFMPSKLEGLGTSLLDAMVCRLPIVATRTGGIPEIVIHDQTGLLADIGDVTGLASEILRLIQSPELSSQLTAKAHQMVDEKFTSLQTASQTLQHYQQLLSLPDVAHRAA